MTEIVDIDVLVVGGGGAAARAALEAARAGASVNLAVKGRFGAIGTRGSGATAGGASEVGHLRVPEGVDGRDAGFADILQLGLGLADRKLARILVDEVSDSREVLKRLGAVFGGGGIKCHGGPVMFALESGVRNSTVIVRDGIAVTDLLVEDGRCAGAVGLVEADGTTVVFRAEAVVLGTGGAGQLYELNIHPDCVTGDGYAMGYRAGADFINMEFNQVLLGSVYPTENLAPVWMYVQSPIFTNRLGRQFITDYLPEGVSLETAMKQRSMHAPFSTRDTVSRYVDAAMIGEIKAGRATDHLGVYMDLTGEKPSISNFSREWWRYRGIDIERELIEVAPCFQCSDGGFRIDEQAQTSLPGLYAAGEAAAGPHGADRRGGNMLAMSQVFGAIAGKQAANWATQFEGHRASDHTVADGHSRVMAYAGARGDVSPDEIARPLRRLASEDLMAVRSQESLQRVLDQVHAGREAMGSVMIGSPRDLLKAVEVDNMLLVAEMTARAAMMRTESRGGHFRTDYPERDDRQWLRAIRVARSGDDMRLDTFVIDPQWEERTSDMGNVIWG